MTLALLAITFSGCSRRCPEEPVDADGDGFVASACGEPVDCDDTDPAVHPGAADPCNGRDDDCDGTADGVVCVEEKGCGCASGGSGGGLALCALVGFAALRGRGDRSRRRPTAR